MLAIQAKQQELKRLLDLQDLRFEQPSTHPPEEGESDGDLKAMDGGSEEKDRRVRQGKERDEEEEEQEEGEEGGEDDEPEAVLELNRPQTLSLSLGLLGIFVAVAICCVAILYQIQHKTIN
jgi:uncharacterized membrane protein YdbT with pleckstrin-like domain